MTETILKKDYYFSLSNNKKIISWLFSEYDITLPMVKINGVFTPYTECIERGEKPLSKQDDLFLIATLADNEADTIVVNLENYLTIIDNKHFKRFHRVETILNEMYESQVHKSCFYTVNLIHKKNSFYKSVEIKTSTTSLFVPKVYIDFKDDFNEKCRDFNLSIQTTSYGSLEIDKFKEFLSIQNEAMKHIEEIESIVRCFMNE